MFRGGRFNQKEDLERRRQDVAEAGRRRAQLIEKMKTGKGDPNVQAEPPLQVVPSLSLRFGDGPDANAPLIAQALLCAAIRSSGKPVCVVLPETHHVAALVAVLGSLEHLAADHEAKRSDYVTHEMVAGRRVLSLADGLVYGVGGTTDLRGPGGVFLQYLDAQNAKSGGRFVVPPSELFSYEPTERHRPAGKPGKAPPTPPLASFDHACGVRTYGNSNLIRNRIVLLGSKAGFERYLEGAAPSVVDVAGCAHPLGDDLPWGSLTETGRLTVEGPRSGLGEPLVAVSRDPLLLREACASRTSEKGSRIVISDNVDVVMRSVDLVERIGERQSFLLLANGRSRDAARELKRRGWVVWEPQPWELGPDFAGDASAGHGLERSLRSLHGEAHASLSFHTANSDALNAAYASFCKASDLLAVNEGDQDEDVVDAAAVVRASFFAATDWLEAPDAVDQASFDDGIRTVGQNVRLFRRSAGEEAADAVNEFLDRLADHAREVRTNHVSAKGEALVDLVGNGRAQTVIVGHARAAERTNKFLTSYGADARCVTPSELDVSTRLDNVVVTSALSPDAFAKIVDPWPSSNVAFSGYAFETAVYRRRLQTRARTRASLVISPGDRTRLSGMSPDKFGTYVEPDPAIFATTPQAVAPPVETIASFEALAKPRKWDWSRRPNVDRASVGQDTLPAVFCRFVGRSWATFTTEHRPVALITAAGEPTIVRQIDMSDLRVGHRIIMRDAGERDAIRLVAEDRCGTHVYAELRRRAQLWRDRLGSMGGDVEDVAERLARVGVKRNFVTVRSWLRNPDVLGPRSRQDLLGIAEAFGSPSIGPGTWDLCWDAIEQLRTLHVTSGGILSRMLAQECRSQLIEPTGREIPVHLSLGMVWVLEVGHVDEKPDDWPASSINRLQWDEYGWREKLLGEATTASKAA